MMLFVGPSGAGPMGPDSFLPYDLPDSANHSRIIHEGARRLASTVQQSLLLVRQYSLLRFMDLIVYSELFRWPVLH